MADDGKKRGVSAPIVTDALAHAPDDFILRCQTVRLSRTNARAPSISTAWSEFGGTLLCLSFGNSPRQKILGSAVMVAPGIAVTATHVVADGIATAQPGERRLAGLAICHEKLNIWGTKQSVAIDGTDLSVLVTTLQSPLQHGQTFLHAAVSTRIPALGETVTIAGFRPSMSEFESSPLRADLEGLVVVSTGLVSAQYPHGRDRHLIPWPCFEVNVDTLGAMSGGPVYDKHGDLVGVLCSGIDGGTSYVSMIWPALTCEFEPQWPARFFPEKVSLVKMDKNFCVIAGREKLRQEGRSWSCDVWT